ncbi:hypothetical protein [Flagellimonas sp.]|jgi:hypothetical protein|uniref:hypothetical protein n=1 Tax=Flagellimonas sp. TaxID=2058762 RepID=UPI003BAB2C57
MKIKLLTIVLGLYVIGTTGQELINQDTHIDSKDKKAILLNFQRQEECWNKKDIDCFMEAYSKINLVQAISSNGIVYGYERILSNYKERYYPNGTVGQLSFDRFNFRKLTRKLYFVVGRYNLKLEERDKLVQGWFSVIMKKEKERWVILTDHSS